MISSVCGALISFLTMWYWSEVEREVLSFQVSGTIGNCSNDQRPFHGGPYSSGSANCTRWPNAQVTT